MTRTVLHIGTEDGAGGAGRAARRLVAGQRSQGWDAWMVSGLSQVGGDRTTTLNEVTRGHKPRVAGVLERALHVGGGALGDRRLPVPSSRAFPRTELFDRAELIHLHNLHGFFFDYSVLPDWAARKPLVWTLHDMWAATGHCAYSFGCERWVAGCHDCPLWEPDRRALDEIPQTPWDSTRGEWRRKRRAYATTPLTVIAPSRWLSEIAGRSILRGHRDTTVHHVPYGLDTHAYRPVDRAAARALLDLPEDVPIVLFGAASPADERKGMGLLSEAMKTVRAELPEVRLVAFGAMRGAPAGLQDTLVLGQVSDARLQRAVYAAADLVAVPSRADNQPLVMLEAMACGTPVAAFAVGGIPEVVRDGETGVLAPDNDARALGEAIARVLGNTELRDRLGAAAREQVEREHDLERQARRVLELYETGARPRYRAPA